MRSSLLLRSLLCIATGGSLLYSYIDLQNEITKRRLEIPLLAKELKAIREKNTCLLYEIEMFESPEHLISLSSRSEYAHLKQPLLQDILAFREEKPSVLIDPAFQDPALASSSVLMGSAPARLSQ